MSKLLQEDEQLYQKEVRDSEETPAQRNQRMADRAWELKRQREADR